MIVCLSCNNINKENSLFCTNCDKELFETNQELELNLGIVPSKEKQELIKKLILDLNHICWKADKAENDRERLIWIFQMDLVGYASDAYNNQIYLFPQVKNALIKTAKHIFSKL